MIMNQQGSFNNTNTAWFSISEIEPSKYKTFWVIFSQPNNPSMPIDLGQV